MTVTPLESFFVSSPSEHDVFHGVLVESVRCLAEPGRMVGATLEQEIELCS